MSNATRMTGEQIREHLQNYHRDPFQNELAKLLENAPNPTSVKRFANKAPDRYMQAVTIAAKLSGYSEKIQVDVNYRALSTLADSELRTMLRDLTIKLRQLEAIDVTPEHVEETSAQSAEGTISVDSNSEPPSK